MTITADQLKAIIPAIKPAAIEIYLPHLQNLLPQYHIDTPQRVAGFIAQVAHESANFSAVREFASGKAYEGRADLGNLTPGDGVRYNGRGLIQVTGRANYRACSQFLFRDNRLLDNPELLTTPGNAVRSACWFWTQAKNLNAVCDHPEDWHHDGQHHYSKIEYMTLLVNGGQNGIGERTANYNRARAALNF